MKKYFLTFTTLLGLSLVLSGCTNNIKFDSDFTYQSPVPKLKDTALTVVLSPDTLKQQQSIRAWSGGEANLWVVHIGTMLKQFIDTAMPQYVAKYKYSQKYTQPPEARYQYIVQVAVPSYEFAGSQARITLNFQVYNLEHTLLFVKNYSAESPRHGIEMWTTGAFTMGSIIQESTANAYGKAFSEFMYDLKKYEKK